MNAANYPSILWQKVTQTGTVVSLQSRHDQLFVLRCSWVRKRQTEGRNSDGLLFDLTEHQTERSPSPKPNTKATNAIDVHTINPNAHLETTLIHHDIITSKVTKIASSPLHPFFSLEPSSSPSPEC